MSTNQTDPLSPEFQARVNAELKAALPENQPGINDNERIMARWTREATAWRCPNEGPHIRAQAAMQAAMCGRLSYADFENTLLRERCNDSEVFAIRAERPQAPAIHGSSRDAFSAGILPAYLLIRAGRSAVAEKVYGEQIMDSANKFARQPAMDFVKACLEQDGRIISGSPQELVKAGFSTVSMPQALGTAGEKILLDSYLNTSPAWRSWCNPVNVSSFRDHTLIRPNFKGGFQQVPRAGELKHANVAEETATIRADTYGRVLTVDRQTFIDDNLGAFAITNQEAGKAAARKLADLVATTLLAGNGTFFSEANNNRLTDALSLSAVASAIQAMRSQVDADGNSLDLQPKTLLVPPELESTAVAICQSEFIQAAEGAPSGNSLKGLLVPVVEPRLSNPSISGNSSTCWFLFASPSDSPQAVCFLNGQQFPIVEEMGLQAQVDVLAYSWRCYHDFGTSLVDWRAAVMSTGAGA